MCCCFDSNLWKYYHIILCIFISICFIVGSAFDFNIYCSTIWILLHCKTSEGKKKIRRKYFFIFSFKKFCLVQLCTVKFSLLYFVFKAWLWMLKSRTCIYLNSVLIWMENVGVGIAQTAFLVPFRAQASFLDRSCCHCHQEGWWNQVTRVLHQTGVQSSSTLAEESLCKASVESFCSVRFV